MNVTDVSEAALPPFLNAQGAARLLRCTRKAIYARAERGQLPGVVRDGRRILVRTKVLVDWLCQQGASSPQGVLR